MDCADRSDGRSRLERDEDDIYIALEGSPDHLCNEEIGALVEIVEDKCEG